MDGECGLTVRRGNAMVRIWDRVAPLSPGTYLSRMALLPLRRLPRTVSGVSASALTDFVARVRVKLATIVTAEMQLLTQ